MNKRDAIHTSTKKIMYIHTLINSQVFFILTSSRFVTYFMQVDVKDDGNCGFQEIAVCLGRHEDEWPSI
ncbi:hypothetical protein OSB04_011844 [Centaurea solstitialis]|uniref:Uncharacterized protein n=1 Tax=Centaurea solstitialis TaxID=347529 RepID=A0AA38TLY7_9ASTR|nr:hypothetical protein OSB04_011844 [Centaurea solstitialis]